MKRGRLVTFSGLDGCGKSTQIEALVTALAAEGERPHRVWSRGGYTEGVLLLKRLLRRGLGARAPTPGQSRERAQTLARPGVARVWLSAAMLDLVRLYAVELRVRRALGQAVVCDRYLWDTLADFQVNFPNHDVEATVLWRLLTRLAPKPDAAFFLDIDPETAERRATEKNDPFPEPLDARKRRAGVYQRLLTRGYFTVISATSSRESIAGLVRHTLDDATSSAQEPA